MNQIENENLSSSDEEAAEDEKLVPVSESIRYRKRAQNAEKKAALLEAELIESKSAAKRLDEKLQNLTKEKELVQELISAGAADIETATLLANARIEKQSNSDVASVIAELKKEKGYLFNEQTVGQRVAQKTSGARDRTASTSSALQRAAQKAASTGSRMDLQEYLRMRRNFV